MKTQIDISNESLHSAATKYGLKEQSLSSFDHFISGAAWQKEKDKAIQDKAIKVLTELIRFDASCIYIFEKEFETPDGILNAWQNVKQLLKSLEQDT